MDAAARPIQLEDATIPDEAPAPSGSRSRSRDFRGFANSTVGRFLLVLLLVFIAKQLLTVLVFPPFT